MVCNRFWAYCSSETGKFKIRACSLPIGFLENFCKFVIMEAIATKKTLVVITQLNSNVITGMAACKDLCPAASGIGTLWDDYISDKTNITVRGSSGSLVESTIWTSGITGVSDNLIVSLAGGAQFALGVADGGFTYFVTAIAPTTGVISKVAATLINTNLLNRMHIIPMLNTGIRVVI